MLYNSIVGCVISFTLTIKRNVFKQIDERNVILNFANKPARVIDRLSSVFLQSVSHFMLIGATRADVMSAQRNCDFDGSKFQ